MPWPKYTHNGDVSGESIDNHAFWGGGGMDGDGGTRVYKLEETQNHHIPEDAAAWLIETLWDF